MDMCMLDVSRLTEIPSVSEEVVLFGQQNYQGKKYDLPVDEVADLLDTINYEITCLIGKRVPRVYIRNGEIVHMHSCIW
jgi:alanine racemase